MRLFLALLSLAATLAVLAALIFWHVEMCIDEGNGTFDFATLSCKLPPTSTFTPYFNRPGFIALSAIALVFCWSPMLLARKRGR
jgi:hypothetical protein